MHITKEEQLIFINTHDCLYRKSYRIYKKGIKLKSLARSPVKRIIEKLNYYISIYTSNENFLIGKKYLK